MKKLIGALFLVLLFAVLAFPQSKQVRGFSVVEDLGTQANSAQETVYLDLRDWKSVDSVTVSLSAVGEIDVDTINFYIGNFTPDGFISDAAAGVLYNAVTLNLADGATDYELLLTTGATVLTSGALRGCNGIKGVIEIAAAGSDATDPNALYIHWKIHGTK